MTVSNSEPEQPFLLATPNTDDGRSGLVSKAPDHLLPYGVTFEEYRARRPLDLRNHAADVLNLPLTTPPERIWAELKSRVEEVTARYETLAELKKKPTTPPSAIDDQLALCSEADKPLKRLLHLMDGSALCLSGGGIRSASFGLGVLQGLARFSIGILDSDQVRKKREQAAGLLHKLDYLSTVSGGGYIGSWLSAWTYRRWRATFSSQQELLELARKHLERMKKGQRKSPAGLQDPELQEAETRVREAQIDLQQAKAANLPRCYREVVEALAGDAPTTSADPAQQTVRHLREYTSYLSPSLGLSLDSWTLAAIFFRNMFINWLMLLPMLVAAVALPQVSYRVSRDIKVWLGRQGSLEWLGLVAVGILFLIAARFAGKHLPSHRKPSDAGPSLARTVLSFAFPVMLANWILVELWWSISGTVVGKQTWTRVMIAILIISFAGMLWLCTWIFTSYLKRIRKSMHRGLGEGASKALRLGLMILAAFVSACFATALAGWLGRSAFPALVRNHVMQFGKHSTSVLCCQAAQVKPLFSFHADERLFMLLAVPLVTIIPLLTISLLSGLLGVFEMEEDREWWSKVGAIQLAVITVWILAHAISLYSKDALTAIWLAISGIGLGGIGSALGYSGTTSAGPRPVKDEQKGKLGSFLEKHDLLLPALCGAALLLLGLGAAGGEVQIANRLSPTLHGYFAKGSLDAQSHIVVLIAAVLAAVLLNWAISVNLFSLNGLYRMRLMRAFLGASNTQRLPDNFTGFDPNDTPSEIDLPDAPGAPLHVVNTTLNLVGTKNTAWRQRKAEPFSFSPLHSGSWRLGYVPTRYYAGADGPSLATTMTISGAAFNPNMGYHSSPLVTLVMTFFNLRLGWWLPNPRREEGARVFKAFSPQGKDFLRRTGPSLALEPMIREALGMTDDDYRWIELTDGGHFENLGLYEMVMRRCKKIIVVDAGADPKCQFEDLGNALRKIEIDLGIPIRFDHVPMHAGPQPKNRYCAVATIDYKCVDDDAALPLKERAALAGTLIYIKAGLTGNEPPDVKQYSLTHTDFPHETTANQFFNEAQFESYRHLGSFEVETIVKEGSTTTGVKEVLKNLVATKAPLGDGFDAFAEVAKRYSTPAGKG